MSKQKPQQFRKLVCIESASRMVPEALAALKDYAQEVVLYDDIPATEAEIGRRIADADAILVSYTSVINGAVLEQAANLRYIGMCCSLYGPESANVDIRRAEELGIVTTGVYQYGDRGVPEYVIAELVRLLHGFYGPRWREEPQELTGQRVGVLGLGLTGSLVAQALHFFGAQVHYYSRSRKPQLEQQHGYIYLPLEQLLPTVDILCCCLNKNTVLLHDREFELLGDGKIIINTSIGPVFDLPALEQWLARPGNFAAGDLVESIDPSGRLQKLPNVFSPLFSSGMTAQARVLLGQKVIANLRRFLGYDVAESI